MKGNIMLAVSWVEQMNHSLIFKLTIPKIDAMYQEVHMLVAL